MTSELQGREVAILAAPQAACAKVVEEFAEGVHEEAAA